MTDETSVCAAAFFRTIGKDVTTSDEFVMTSSLELKWMQPSDSKLLLAKLLREGTVVMKGDFIRPSKDLGDIDVPMSYRPSKELVSSLRSTDPPASAKTPAPPAAKPQDVFHKLIDVAKNNGIEQKMFIPESNKLSRALDVDIAVAALIILKQNKVDVAPYIGEVRASILG